MTRYVFPICLLLTYLLICTRPVFADRPQPSSEFKAAPKPLNVLFIGDACIEQGNITGRFSREIESRFGYYGSGYRSLYAEVGNGKPGTQPYLIIKNDGTWTPQRIGPHGNPDARSSPDGTCIRADASGATTTVDFFGDRIDVYYRVDSKSGSFAVTLDSDNPVSVDAHSGSGVRKSTFTAKSRAWHRISISVILAPVMLLGVDAQSGPTDDARIVVHKWGNSNASTGDFLSISEGSAVTVAKSLNPTVVVIMLGSNDHMVAVSNFWYYETNLAILCTRIRLAVPKARIIIASTLPIPGSPSLEIYHSYLRTMPLFFRAIGIDFVDIGAWIGSPEKALADSWVLPDNTASLSAVGSGKVATRLLDLLIGNSLPPVTHEVLTDQGSVDPNLPELKQIAAWLPADGNMSVDAAGRVARWDSPVSKSYAQQVVPEWRPTMIENVIAGHPAVHFDGKSAFMVLRNASSTSPWMGSRGMSIVFRVRTPTGSMLGERPTTVQPFGPGKAGTVKLFDPRRGKLPSAVWVNGKPTKPDEVEAPVGDFKIISVDFSINAVVTSVGLNQYLESQDKTFIERLTYLDGDIAELVIYAAKDSVATPAEIRLEVEKYLGAKYAIALTP